jgi:polyisoprenyl-phosphate glycosyltransferase
MPIGNPRMHSSAMAEGDPAIVASSGRHDKLILLIPVYNDWQALSLLLPILERELNASGLRADILLVDDGSTIPRPPSLGQSRFTSIETVEILSLRRNLGHQRAIAVGLSYVEANRLAHAVVVMDCDGQDDPRDVARLVQACVANGGEKIIFAARTRRSESLSFRVFYHLYRLVHFLLTGVPVRVGNFSVIPWGVLNRLVAVSELWNHYAAAVHKARFPMALVPTERRPRLQGPTQMDVVALVVHGLSAMAVFGDRIGVRLLILVGFGMALAIGGLIAAISVRLLNPVVLPGLATYVTGLLLIMLMQMFLVVLAFAFVILAARDTASIIPSRDYIHITGGIQHIYSCSGVVQDAGATFSSPNAVRGSSP